MSYDLHESFNTIFVLTGNFSALCNAYTAQKYLMNAKYVQGYRN